MMLRYPGFALKFETKLSFNAMWKALNKSGPWHWRASDSDNYGDKLWCYAKGAAKLQIIGRKPAWIVQVGFLPESEVTPEDIRRILDERLFPAILARGVEPTDTVI